MKKIMVLTAGVFAVLTVSAAEFEFEVDAAAQVDGNRVVHAVDNTTVFTDEWKYLPENPPQDWALERWDGIFKYVVGWWGMSSPQENYTETEDGEYLFKPTEKTKKLIDFVLESGMEPRMYFSSNNMPAPLIEGGYKAGFYKYNVRQPKDYDKWQRYIESTLQWLIDNYGLERVRSWSYRLGVEADWQFKAVKPGTEEPMGEKENRREFMKFLDYFVAALENKLGKDVYVGIYVAKVTQAPDYLEHWARGTNYATGEIGTRVGYLGFSDWYHLYPNAEFKEWYDPDKYVLNPFRPQKETGGSAHGMAYHGGMVWKYNYLDRLISKYPELDRLELAMPESGYIQVGSGFPSPIFYADYRGCALYSMRLMAYAACPRLRWSTNRYGLDVGTYFRSWIDTVKAPIFHALKIQQKVEGDRVLSVLRNGQAQSDQDDLRVLATAPADENKIRLLAVNFCEAFFTDSFDAEAEKKSFSVKLTGLPPVKSVKVKFYLVDERHNNWWQDWVDFREKEGLEYVGRNKGPWVAPVKEFQPWVNDLPDTLKKKDWPVWREKQEEYLKREGLQMSAEKMLSVKNGTVELDLTLNGMATLFAELEYELPGGAVRELDDHLEVIPGKAPEEMEISKLEPNTIYTLTARGRASRRMLDYGISLGSEAEPAVCWGSRNARWNQLAVSAKSDGQGCLQVGLTVPKKVDGNEDTVIFEDIRIRRTEW